MGCCRKYPRPPIGDAPPFFIAAPLADIIIRFFVLRKLAVLWIIDEVYRHHNQLTGQADHSVWERSLTACNGPDPIPRDIALRANAPLKNHFRPRLIDYPAWIGLRIALLSAELYC